MDSSGALKRPKISVYIATSIDGYIAQEDGGLDWLERTPTPNEDFGFREFMDSVDALVMGRKTYDVVCGFGEWPYQGKRVIVISQTLDAIREEAELFSGDIEDLVSGLYDEGVKHIYVDGGLTISRFLDAGVVDQMIITVIPIILGKGIRLFNPMDREHDCKLTAAKPYPSGLVQLRYEMSHSQGFHSSYVNTLEHRLFVETQGEKESPTCVLIPGAMQGAWGWSDPFCDTIANSGFRVVRFDHRDIGRSSATPEGQAYDLADLAKDVISILDQLEIPQAHLVGHSMGGHLCQQLALDAPGRVSSICLLGSSPIGATTETEKKLTDEEEAILAETWKVFLERKDSKDQEERIHGFIKVYSYLSGTIPVDEQIALTYVKRMLESSPEKYLNPGNPHERLMQELGKTLHDRRGILGKIHTPTLVIHGELDPIALPRFARSMAEEIPNAKIKIIEGMGHMFLCKELEDTLAKAIIEHMRSCIH